MGKIIETTIDRFDGGVSSDLRDSNSRQFSITKHFDIFTNPKKLTPYRAFEANETTNINIVKFLNANSQIYGFGTTAGTAIAKIYKKDGNLVTGGWTEDQAVNGTGARNTKAFFHYKDYLYYWAAGTALWRHGDITATATNASYQSITYTNIAQPVHHPADDIAYFFYDNVVAKLDNTTFTDAVLTLPSNLIITAGVAFGNLLAIACKDKNIGSNNSTVFLWDRDSSLATITDKIDWGLGELVVLDIVDGVLTGVSNIGSDSVFKINSKIHIKALSGNTPILVKEIELNTSNVDQNYKATGDWQTKNSKLYFTIHSTASVDGADYTGVWVAGRHEISTPFAVTLAYKVDTSATSPSDQIQGFRFFEDYLFVAHSSDGSVERTNDQATYATGVYESQIFNTGDSSLKKDLVGATVMTDPLPTAGQIVLKYRVDAETSWSSAILTEGTDSSISSSVVTGLPKDYKEIQFRIESTGGAEITGLSFKEEITGKRLYD